MTPYYSDDLVTIYHGDCRDVVPWLDRAFLEGRNVQPHATDDEAALIEASASVDVVVTDPPYGTNAYATDTLALDADLLREWTQRFRSVAVFGWPERLVGLCVAAGLTPDEWVTWWPTNAELKGRFAKVPVARDSEHIALFGELREARGAPVRNTHDYAGTGNNRSAHHISPKGKRWGDVWRDASPGLAFHAKKRLHPNEKPVSLMARTLDLVADGTVLDPFMGSGTTLIAARLAGRRAIGIEIDEAHCETAARRCSQEVLGLVG